MKRDQPRQDASAGPGRAIGKLSLLLMVLAVPGLAEDGAVNRMHADRNTDKPDWLRRNYGKMAWYEIVDSAVSPEEVCSAVRRHVKYRKDGTDEWATGKETWKRGYGDCEDIAACVQELCKELGFNASVRLFYGKKTRKAHAIVIGDWNGRKWLSSNGSYHGSVSAEDNKKNMASLLVSWERDIGSVAMSEVKRKPSQNAGWEARHSEQSLLVGARRNRIPTRGPRFSMRATIKSGS